MLFKNILCAVPSPRRALRQLATASWELIGQAPNAFLPRSRYAVDRNGQQKFQKDFVVKGLRPPKAALRALDNKILLKHTAAVAIDGFL